MAGYSETRLAYCEGDAWAHIPTGGGLLAGISLARSGDMGLSAQGSIGRRGAFLESAGWTGGPVFALRQVHSHAVLAVEGRMPAELLETEADGLACGGSGALLTVTVADCLPVFLRDRAGAYALVHSGWKGTGIAAEAVGLLCAVYGSKPGDISAVIGPGIGACCYPVPRDRWEGFRREFGAEAAPRGESGDFRLDLRRANVDLLQRAGVRDMTVITDCTACSPALGSFRRQGPQDFSRMLAFLGRARGGAP